MKNNLQTGDILHCKSNGFLAKGIKFATKSQFNHTAMVIRVGDEVMVIDAQANGVNIKTFDSWNKKYNYDYEISRKIHTDAEWGSNIRSRAFSKAGITRYDIPSLVLFQPIYLVTGKWVGRTKEKAEKKFYCSEIVAWVIGIEDFWLFSPDKLYKYLKQDNEWMTFQKNQLV